MRRSLILSLVVIMAFSGVIIVEKGDSRIVQPHWTPETPDAGEEFTLFLTIDGVNGSLPQGARVLIDGIEIEMVERNRDGNHSILYSATLVHGEKGNLSIKVESKRGDSWIEEGNLVIWIEEGEEEDDVKTILGLPSWYCSISVLILTVFVIFLTWAYFRGRSMVRSRKQEVRSGPSAICSECGKKIKMTDTSCPWCGVTIDDDEYICGNCGENVSPEDKKCEKCGTSLGRLGSSTSSEVKKKMNTTRIGKRECGGCGTVLMQDEGKCPVCGQKGV